MIREIVTSKAAKLLAACVCPVAGAGLVTVKVPPVRHAVYKATAPRTAAASPIRPAVDVPCGKAEPILITPTTAQNAPKFDFPALERSIPTA